MGYFLPFYPPDIQKNQNFEKIKKTPGDIIILYMCTKNYDQIMYGSWDMVWDRRNCYFSFWAIFCPFTLLTAKKKSKFWKNEKNAWRYHFTYVYQKLWSDDIWFLRYAARQTDGQRDGQTDRRIDGKTEKVTYRGGCPT